MVSWFFFLMVKQFWKQTTIFEEHLPIPESGKKDSPVFYLLCEGIILKERL